MLRGVTMLLLKLDIFQKEALNKWNRRFFNSIIVESIPVEIVYDE